MRRVSFASLLLALPLCADPTELPKDAVPLPFVTFNFDRDPVGALPPAWEPPVDGAEAAKQWEIAAVHDAFSAPQVLRRSPGKPSAETHVALLKDIVRDHGEIAVRIKTLSTTDDQTAGIIFNYTDPKNYWILSLSTRDDACSVFRVSGGKRKLIDSKDSIIPPFRWHELRLVFANKTYTALVNRELLLGGKSAHAKKPGRLGVFIASNAAVLLDDFQISQ